MKTVNIPVGVTSAQLEYLASFGYFMRATPAEILLAGALAYIDLQSRAEDTAGDWNRAFLNFVTEKRIPAVHTDQIEDSCDIGEFTDSVLKKRREKMDTMPATFEGDADEDSPPAEVITPA